MSYEEICQTALQLPESDRANLYEMLGVSLGYSPLYEDSEGFEREIMRRSDEIHAGTAKTYSTEEVFAHVDEALKRVSQQR